MASAFRYASDWSQILNRLGLTHDSHGEAEGIEWGAAVPMLEDRDRLLEDYLANLKGSTLAVAGQPALSGAVVLNAGQNITLNQAGQNITVGAVAQNPRPFSVYAPGTLAAAVLQKLTVSNAVLTQVDAYFQTAPVGVSGASCANLKISGALSGSLTIPFSVATPEYHLTSHPGIFFGQVGADNSGRDSSGGGPYYPFMACSFTATAAGQIGSIDANIHFWGAPTAGEVVRMGVVTPQFTQGAAIPTLASIPWALDVNGNKAYLDIPVGSIPRGATNSIFTTWLLNTPVNIVQSQTYAVAGVCVNAAGTGIGTSPMIWEASNPATWSGNGSGGWSVVARNDTGLWDVLTGAQPQLLFDAYGAGTGVTLTGLVTVETTMTGTPATPGGNLNVSIQL